MTAAKVFFVANGGERSGPLTREQVAKLLTESPDYLSALIWTDGMSSWHPVAPLLSDFVEVEKDQLPNPRSVPANTGGSSRDVGPVSRSAPIRFFFSIALATILIVAFFWYQSSFTKLEPPALSVFAWVTTILACIVSSCFLLSELWPRSIKKLDSFDSSAYSGTRRVSSAFLGVAILCFGVIYLSASGAVYRISKARLAYSNYDFKVDVASHSVNIVGTVGPDLGRKVRDALNTYSGIDFIRIRSPGGLLDEALDAARAIEDHPNVTLFTDGECNSACIPILLSGQKRFADGMMSLGFHASNTITAIPNSDMPALNEMAREYYDYLASRNVPQSVIDETKSLGPKRVNLVPSIDLVDVGALTGVTFDGSRVPAPTAKWLYVERKLGSSNGGAAIASLLAAIRSVDAETVTSFSDSLYKALASQDTDVIRAAIASVISSVKADAINSADPEAVLPYIQINAKQLETLRESELWDACRQYAQGAGVSDVSKLSSNLVNSEIETLTAMVKSGGQSHWEVRPLPNWAEKVGRGAMLLAAQRIRSQGFSVERIDSEPKAACAFSAELFAILAQLQPIAAVGALRWVNSLNSQ